MVSQRTLIIECGSNRASLAVFSCAGLRLKLLQCETEPFPGASLGEDDGQWLGLMQTALGRLRKKVKYRGAATLVLPAHRCLTKFIKLPKVEGSARERILRFEAEQNIPHALSDVVWGTAVATETDTETDLFLAAARQEFLDSLCDAANAAGFEIQAALPAQCATLAGFGLAAGTNGEGFLGLHIGESTSTLVATDATRFALRSFSAGAKDAVTLQQEIVRSLLHFQWRNGMTRPNRVYVAGWGAASPELIEAISAKLASPVKVCGCPADFASEAGDDKISVPENERDSTLLDVSGAAAIRSDPRLTRVDLLSPRMIERVRFRRRRPWLTVAALLAVGSLIPPALHFTALRDEAIKKAAAIERELVPLRSRDSRIRKNLEQIDEIKGRLAYYQQTNERRDSWVRFLARLQQSLDEVEDVWLEKLQLTPPVANAPMKLMVSGRLLDRARPLAKASSESFSRVNALLTHLAQAPAISAVESEHFDSHLPGLLQFEFVFVTDERQPL